MNNGYYNPPPEDDVERRPIIWTRLIFRAIITGLILGLAAWLFVKIWGLA